MWRSVFAAAGKYAAHICMRATTRLKAISIMMQVYYGEEEHMRVEERWGIG
jgi:hypothetical protein